MTVGILGVVILAAIAVFVVAAGKREPKTAAHASPQTGAPVPNPSGGQGHDLQKQLKALLYADQTLKDELLSMVQFSPEIKQALALLEKGECPEALRQANADETLPPETRSLLLAHVKAACGDQAGAVAELRKDLATVEGAAADQGQSHSILQTWFRLRQLGVQPETMTAMRTLGVIVEMGFPEGTNTIAGYADGSSRHFTRQGGGIAGPERRPEVQEAARQLVDAAQTFVKSAQSLQDRNVKPGIVRFTFLTPGGPLASETTTEEIQAGTSPLMPLFAMAGQLSMLKNQGYGPSSAPGPSTNQQPANH